MKHLFSILCQILVLPVLVACERRGLREFRQMVECKLPDRDPLLDFWDYGCYCGLGGGGTPVDDLDRCCQAHDECYDKAQNLESCGSIFDSPYFNGYEFDCDEQKTITCLSTNNDCDMFICTCDKVAVDCFASVPYDDSKNGLPDEVCTSFAKGLLPSLFLMMLVTLLCQTTLERIFWL